VQLLTFFVLGISIENEALSSQLALPENYQHNLTNVSFLTEVDGSHKLQCMVDNSIRVEIISNARIELCLLSFFEEFDRLIGRDHLFKRSLLLIRAWWHYEVELGVFSS
jgi:hypothetical protein